MTIDVDGGITIDGVLKTPFPADITHAAICDKGLVATWVDHELRLARMALLSLDSELKDGGSRSDLRTSKDSMLVEGAEWCHFIDAEPLALVADGDRIVFTLWSRGIYCISSDSTEIWRSPLREVDGPPMSNEVKQLFIDGEALHVWSRNGDHSILSMDDGSVISSHQYGVEIDLDSAYFAGEHFLLSSRDGTCVAIESGKVTTIRKIRGTIQDAAHDGEDWRIISWRDDLKLHGEITQRSDLGVQLFLQEGTWMVLDNQWERSPHQG